MFETASNVPTRWATNSGGFSAKNALAPCIRANIHQHAQVLIAYVVLCFRYALAGRLLPWAARWVTRDAVQCQCGFKLCMQWTPGILCVCVFSSPCLTKYSLSRNYLALGAEANGGAQNVHKTYHVGVLLLMDYAGCPCSSCANYCKLFTPFHNSPNTGS